MIGPSGIYSTGGVFFAIRLRCRESYEYASGSIVTTYFLLQKTASSVYMLTISVVHDIVLDDIPSIVFPTYLEPVLPVGHYRFGQPQCCGSCLCIDL